MQHLTRMIIGTLLVCALLTTSGCFKGEVGGGGNNGKGNWDTLKWDQDKWQ